MNQEFMTLLADMEIHCAWESIPYSKIPILASLCGRDEIMHLIAKLEILVDPDPMEDAGDIGDEIWRLRVTYSETLAEVGEPAVEPLLTALNSRSANTREYAALALGKIGNSRAFEPICALLEAEADKGNYIMALGMLKDQRGIDILLPYLKSAPDESWTLRLTSSALGEIGTERVIQPLAEILRSHTNSHARFGAVEGLSKISDPKAFELLREALHDSDEQIRQAAQKALTRRR
jgi:HEAT repeat protein